MVESGGWKLMGLEDLGPERANAILEYLYHHNVDRCVL